MWLLATEEHANDTDDRVEAVRRAQAPVLLEGTPSHDRAFREESPVRLVFCEVVDVVDTA